MKRRQGNSRDLSRPQNCPPNLNMNSTQGNQGSNGEYYAYYGYSYSQQTYTPQQQQAAWQMYYQQQAQMAASSGLVPPGMESQVPGTSTYGTSTNTAHPYYPYYQQPQPMAYHSNAPMKGSKKASPKVPQTPQPKKAKKPAPEPVLCEPCGKTLNSQHDYEMHVKSHVNCPQCSQVMTKKELKIHLAEDHLEAASFVVETSLDSPEEIAAWIADRKKKYPTDANIQQKAEEKKKKLEKRQLVTGPDSIQGRNKRAKVDGDGQSENNDEQIPPNSKVKNRRICKYFKSKGSCRNGDNCRFSHDVNASSAPPQKKSTETSQPEVEFPGVKRRPLLSLLIEKDIQRDQSLLLQFIRHVVQNQLIPS